MNGNFKTRSYTHSLQNRSNKIHLQHFELKERKQRVFLQKIFTLNSNWTHYFWKQNHLNNFPNFGKSEDKCPAINRTFLLYSFVLNEWKTLKLWLRFARTVFKMTVKYQYNEKIINIIVEIGFITRFFQVCIIH